MQAVECVGLHAFEFVALLRPCTARPYKYGGHRTERSDTVFSNRPYLHRINAILYGILRYGTVVTVKKAEVRRISTSLKHIHIP